MKQITEFGKEVRKIRIEKGMPLKVMAEGLGVPPSYVSSVERGAKTLTAEFVEKAIAFLRLDQREAESVRVAAADSMGTMQLDVENLPPAAKQTAVMFARRLPELTPDELRQVREMLGG